MHQFCQGNSQVIFTIYDFHNNVGLHGTFSFGGVAKRQVGISHQLAAQGVVTNWCESLYHEAGHTRYKHCSINNTIVRNSQEDVIGPTGSKI